VVGPVKSIRMSGALARSVAFACTACACMASVHAFAGDMDTIAAKPTSGFIVTLGGYGLLQPKFEGAKRDELAFRPIFGIRAPTDRVWLDLPNDGLEYEFIETDNFRAGAVGNIRYQRDTTTLGPRGFKKFGKVDLSVEAGGFAEYWPSQMLRTRVEVRDAVIGADGVIADLSADAVVKPSARWILTAGPRISFADKNFMQSYYGVTPSEAATTGIAAYKASAGLRSYGAGTSARYQITDDMTALAFVEYQRLAGVAGESTLIDNRGSTDQVTVGLGLKYSFRVDW
jgi:MipA family protein